MRTLVIADRETQTPLSNAFRTRLHATIEAKGHQVETLEIGARDVVPCFGCLKCVTRDGECVSDDAVAALNRRIGDFDLLIYLGPVVFGQFSSTMKSVTDKTNTVRMLRSRFLIAVGYGDDVRDDEAQTFLDIYRRHRGRANVVHPDIEERFEAFTVRSLADSDAVCAELGRIA